MKTIAGVMAGCFIFAACGQKEKESTYKLETNRAEDMMTRGMRDAVPQYLLMRVERNTGSVAAVVTNADVQPQNEAAYGTQIEQGEQQVFAKGDQVQLKQGVMKIGDSPAQTYYDGGCQVMQGQNTKDFKLGTPQCSPMYAMSKDTGFKYGLGKVTDDSKFSYYRFGLKSYFGKGFDYPFTQQQSVQVQGQVQAPSLSDQTNLNTQVPADQNYQAQAMPYVQQTPAEMPHYQQSPMPVQGQFQYQENPYQQYQANPYQQYQMNGSQNWQVSVAPQQGSAQQVGAQQGNEPPIYGTAPGQGMQGNGAQGNYPVPPGGQPYYGNQVFPYNAGQNNFR